MTEQTFKLDNAQIPNNTILIMGISYSGMGQTDLDTTRGRTTPKVFTYAMLKAGGLWYMTGAGRVPQAAGWLAVMRWLEKDNRRVEWVKVVTETADLWPVVSSPVDTSQASA
jgi:hypothetical protein